MELSKQTEISSMTLHFAASTVDVQWTDRIYEYENLISETLRRRAYTANQIGDLVDDAGAVVAGAASEMLGWA